MKKILFLFLAVATLSSCLDGEETTNEKLRPVSKGLDIYNRTNRTVRATLQPVDVAVRLSLLLAEADKQNRQKESEEEMIDLSDAEQLLQLKAEGQTSTVCDQLFGRNTLTMQTEAGDYTLTLNPQNIGYYTGKGSLVVHTNGHPLLSDTDSSSPWTVTLMPDYKELLARNDIYANFDTILFEGGTFSVYHTGTGYNIVLNGVNAKFSDSKFHSDWSGTFMLTLPADGGLAFSDCHGKLFGFSGSASGGSIFTFDSSTPVRLEYRATEGECRTSTQLLRGTETSTLKTANAQYPASTVTVEWSYTEENSTLTETIDYNGHTVSLDWAI